MKALSSPHTLLLGAALIGLGALPGFAQDTTAAAKAFANAHHKMTMGMDAMKPSGDADKDFVMMMIPHHQGAIDMAEAELKYGKDPALRAMAQEIIKAQKAEIAEMEKWQHGHK